MARPPTISNSAKKSMRIQNESYNLSKETSRPGTRRLKVRKKRSRAFSSAQQTPERRTLKNPLRFIIKEKIDQGMKKNGAAELKSIINRQLQDETQNEAFLKAGVISKQSDGTVVKFVSYKKEDEF